MTDTILRKGHIREITGWSDTHIRALEAENKFPRRFKMNPDGEAVGWLASEVQDWIAARAASRGAGA